VVFGGFLLLFIQIAKGARKSLNSSIRLVLKSLTVVFIGWLMLCGINFPFYSKQSLYPLAFILGSILVFVEKALPEKALQPKRQ
jgi:hypothetical protein